VSAPTAPAEYSPAGAALRPPAERLSPGRPQPGGRAPLGGLLRADALWWPTLLTAAVLCFVTFLAGGGLSLGRMTTVEMVLTIGSGAVVAAGVLLVPAGTRAYGMWPMGLLLALAALTALSVIWSVQPDDSWQDAGRMFAYAGVFAAAVMLVRAAPGRWPAVLGGVTLAAVATCVYALLTKVFPGEFDAGDPYARLRAPYEYWNAIGLTAAMGVIGCMWLGARRAGHALLSALAYPAMGLMIVTLLLAYSRGALAALLLGLVMWFCIVPLRLRGAAVLITGAVAGGLVVAWDFSRHALNTDNIPLAARVSAGHQLGVLLVAMILVLLLAGLAIGFTTDRRAPAVASRRNAGAVLLALLALVVIAFAGALAVSHRGLVGSISHGVHSLTDPHAPVPPNTPGRLTAIGSVRARYWNEGLKIFTAHPVLGAGAEGYGTARLRYRTETLDVRHAHGFLIQTLADLGLVGLVLVLALLASWMAAAGRPTHPFNRHWTGGLAPRGWRSRARPAWRHVPMPYTPERIGMLSMLCLVVVFGIHSLVDWTWYVPGDACVALLCAGWLAGRGPLRTPAAGEHVGDPATAADADADGATLPAGAPDGAGEDNSYGGESPPGRLRLPTRAEWSGRLGDPRTAGVACAAVIAALLAAWSQWQPQRSVEAQQEALALLARRPSEAEPAAQRAVRIDPVSVQALFTLSAVQQARGETALARATLQRAVRLQPSNPQVWASLGEFNLSSDPQSALNELRAAIYLNPESIAPEAIAEGNQEAITLQNNYILALRAASRPAPVARVPKRRRPAARRPSRSGRP
jgi:hypothetical protein